MLILIKDTCFNISITANSKAHYDINWEMSNIKISKLQISADKIRIAQKWTKMDPSNSFREFFKYLALLIITCTSAYYWQEILKIKIYFNNNFLFLIFPAKNMTA